MRAIDTPSRRFPLAPTVLAAAVVLLLGLAACEPATGPERVDALRATYEASLNSFNVRETPMLDESGMDADAMGDEAMGEAVDEGGAADEAAGGDDVAGVEGDEVSLEGDMITEEVPLQQDVLLDIVLRKTGGGGRLDGLTLDVTQVDASENPKTTYHIWVDTQGLGKGSRRAISHVLEDVDFAEGDKFAVDVRANVPAEMYEQYREYSDADGEGDAG